MLRQELLTYLNQFLDITRFHDYAPNGLQVEGKEEIQKIVLGVTASLALIEAAKEQQADLLLVHHGWFWKGESPTITGMKYRRLKALMETDMNLVAYHLPLDAHPEVGNNAQLARRLGFRVDECIGEQNLLCIGSLIDGALSVDKVVGRVAMELGRVPLVLGPKQRQIHRVGWCSGAAQDFLGLAAQAGCDLFLSGEASEQTTHEANEYGVTYIGAGHHATERYGIQALGEHLKKQFLNLEVQYIEKDNTI